MIQILIGSVLLSLVHALIPNHWIPLVAIGKAESWSLKDTMTATAITALAHSLSTIVFGVIIGMIGLKLAHEQESLFQIIAPMVLIGLGLIYFLTSHRHGKHEPIPNEKDIQKKSKRKVVFTLFVAMFFSPCLEIETYYFMAGSYGWAGITLVSLTYLTVTVLGIMMLVYWGRKGIEKFNLHFLQHHEKKITGSLLILLGITGFFIEY